jgi:hypothetical protein
MYLKRRHGCHMADYLPKRQKCNAVYFRAKILTGIHGNVPAAENDDNRRLIIQMENIRRQMPRLVRISGMRT